MASEWNEDQHNDWCPGCGDFGILSALQMSLAKSDAEPHRTAIYSGIGCSGKTNQYVKAYGVHTLHGRVLPFATGQKLANPDLEVIALGGDGDAYGIGAGHFVNAGRRNVDLAYMVHDNNVYGLTKGQAAPTLARGKQTKSLSSGNLNDRVDPLALALASGFTWVGRANAFDVAGLADLITQARTHRGTAILDVLQPCPTYNDLWGKDELGDCHPWDEPVTTGEDDRAARAQAMQQVYGGDGMEVGVLFQADVPTYEERIGLDDPPVNVAGGPKRAETLLDVLRP